MNSFLFSLGCYSGEPITVVSRKRNGCIVAIKDGRYIIQTNGLIRREINELHLAFPIMHGANAEDGSIQGYLNMVGIHY